MQCFSLQQYNDNGSSSLTVSVSLVKYISLRDGTWYKVLLYIYYIYKYIMFFYTQRKIH